MQFAGMEVVTGCTATYRVYGDSKEELALAALDKARRKETIELLDEKEQMPKGAFPQDAALQVLPFRMRQTLLSEQKELGDFSAEVTVVEVQYVAPGGM